MSDHPQPVKGIETEGHIGTIELTWRLPGWKPLVDHFAIHVSTEPDVDISPDTLIGKTVYGRFTHDTLGPEEETRYYRIVTVDAAGRRSRPSKTAKGVSTESMVSYGRPVAQVGEFDYKSLEFALAPASYADYPNVFPNDVDFTYGSSDPSQDWAYLHPGPADRWANNRAHTFRLRFHLDEEQRRPLGLAIWLIDTHATIPGTATVTVNGEDAAEIGFQAGATRGSVEGDATVPGTALRPSVEELELAGRHFRKGENILDITKATGSWLAYDALGVFDLSR